MTITSADDRVTTYSPVSPTVSFAADFPVFDNDDIAVFVDGVEREDFVVTATYSLGISNDAKAVFTEGVTGLVQVVGAREPKRTNRFTNGGPLSIPNLNLALDTTEAEMQEVAREARRAHRAPLGGVGGIFSADQIASAQGYAESAQDGAQRSEEALDAITGLVPSVYPTTIEALKAIDPLIFETAYLKDIERHGTFVWRAGNYSEKVAADIQSGVFIKANSVAASVGAWVRSDGWLISGMNVRWFGAKGDGIADDTAAFKCARDVAYLVGSRSIRVPSVAENLFYKTSDEILLTRGVSFLGDGWQTYRAYTNGTIVTRGAGSWIKVTNPSKPAVNVVRPGVDRVAGVHIKDLAFFWDQPAPGPGFVPNDTEYALRFFGADDCKVSNVLLLNPGKGMIVDGDLAQDIPAGRVDIDGLFGQPFYVGLNCNLSLDVCRWDNIHLWPFWSQQPDVMAWTRANGQAFVSARNDNMQGTNWFAFAYRDMLVINGATSRLKIVNIEGDAICRGLVVNGSAAGSTGEFVNFAVNIDTNTPTVQTVPVLIQAPVSFDFIGSRLTNSNIAAVYALSACTLNFISPMVEDWSNTGGAHAAFNAAHANALIRVFSPTFVRRGATPLNKRGGVGKVEFDFRAEYGTFETTGSLDASGQAVLNHTLVAAGYLTAVIEAKCYYLEAAAQYRAMSEQYIDAVNHVFVSPFGASSSGKGYRLHTRYKLPNTV